jgi:methylmalonyl-CoA/ethylmalonyl-CoA epimerase
MLERSPFGPSARLHHLGIAVPSIAAVEPALESTHDPIQKVRVAFYRQHDLTVELIEPAADDSPVRRSLEQGVKLLHTCYEVDRLEDAIAAGRTAGYMMIRPPVPATAFEGRRIAWVLSKDLGLVELLERASASA